MPSQGALGGEEESMGRRGQASLCDVHQTGGLTVPKEVAEEGKERGERRRSYRHAVFCRTACPASHAVQRW